MKMSINMCDNCSIEHNREQWSKYPDIMDICKMCTSFQLAINKTISEHQKMLNDVARIGKKAKKSKPIS